jgi:dienelactone hydrolase
MRSELPGLHARAAAIAGAALVALAAAGTLRAQTSEPKVTARVTAASDTAMHYAIQLPPNFTPDRKWPTLIIMDPRGRAVRALQVFAEPAARLGWVVISSYETASDDPKAPNARAVTAMLTDARKRWSADDQRFYLAGLSGTARVAWTIAAEMRGAARGVIAAGAGLTGFADLPALADTGDNAVAFVASVGESDYNWAEVKSTDAVLEGKGAPHRMWTFPGGHAWPPVWLATEELEWLEARAMRTGFAPMRADFLDARRARLELRADSLIADRRHILALQVLRDIAADAAGTADSTAADDRVQYHLARPEFRTQFAVEAQLIADEMTAAEEMEISLAMARLQPKLPTTLTLARELKLQTLETMIVVGDRARAASARRRLDRVLLSLVFYEPQNYLRLGDTARARLMLGVAATVADTALVRQAATQLPQP